MLTGTGLASACALGYYAFTRAAHIAFFFFLPTSSLIPIYLSDD
jgi:hypothetical protein